jgi:hypothetical protein
MLDAFDLIVLTLSLTAIGATFAVGTGATGALSTVTLSASGFLAAAFGLGGAIAFGVFGYVLAICALAVLPETQGRDLK